MGIDGDAVVKHDNEKPPASDDPEKESVHNPEQKQSDPQIQENVMLNSANIKEQPEHKSSDAAPNEKNESIEAGDGIRSLEENMVNRLGFLPEEDGELEQTADGKSLYIVFSTDCGSFQHWQSYLLFFSAVRIRQPGFITRIASGCTEEEKQEAREWYQTHIQGENIIITQSAFHERCLQTYSIF